MIKIAINGFGRIGKAFLRAYFADQNAQAIFSIAVINVGPSDPSDVEYIFKYDTVMGRFDGLVIYEKGFLIINGNRIKVIAEVNPDKFPWSSFEVDYVVDCTGKFTHRDQAALHVIRGARKVLVSAPMRDEDVSIIMGVNEDIYDSSNHKIISLGSCTTNALVPLLYIVSQEWGIVAAQVTSIHAYTNTQSLVDTADSSKDKRLLRAAPYNIIPSSTGASKMLQKIMPNIAHRVQMASVRIPLINVSLLDMSIYVEKEVNARDIERVLQYYTSTQMAGIIQLERDSCVSSDFKGNFHSAIVDIPMLVVQNRMVKLFAWYDNEWAYACRLKDFLKKYSN